MIITRTPLRISLGGGGTDLSSYYSRFGGFVLAAAINQYVYITLHRTFQRNFIVKYAQYENVQEAALIQHPIIREAFQMHQMNPQLEMVSMADIPAGTGLGSSGSFTVGLLRAIYAFKREPVSAAQLAEEACHIEIDRLQEPIGKQDQYIAAFGGLSCLDIQKNGEVRVTPMSLPAETLHDLEDNLLMFFTGYSRSASEVLRDQKARTEKEDAGMIDNLHAIKELGLAIRKALQEGDTEQFANLMHQHWLRKKARSGHISNPQINEWYDLAMTHGALGGKLIGAGGGGFLMFYAKDRKTLREALKGAGLEEVRFKFDHEGSKVLVQD